MDEETYETIKNSEARINTKLDVLKERIEALEERRKVPSKIFGEKEVNLDENIELDKVIHPVTGTNTPSETSRIAIKKIIARDTNG